MNFRDWLRTRNTEGYKSMACYSISGGCQAQAISPFKRSNETGLRALCCRSVRRDAMGGTEVKQTEPAWTLSLQSCQYPWKYLWGPPTLLQGQSFMKAERHRHWVESSPEMQSHFPKITQPTWSRWRIATYVRLTPAGLQAAASPLWDIDHKQFLCSSPNQTQFIRAIYNYTSSAVALWSLEKVLGGKEIIFHIMIDRK